MACCCNRGGRSNKSASSCLGRCDLPKHRCLDKREVKPGPVPRNMGWYYTAKDAPEHQLRCGWRPGHISCPVLRRMEHNGSKSGPNSCGSTCNRPHCARPCCQPSPSSSQPSQAQMDGQDGNGNMQPPLIRIIRHDGRYNISTQPANISNAPSGPYPLKYVLNTDEYSTDEKAKFSIEAKFNDYHFDYTSSQSSFVLDFSPPDQKCCKPCPKKSVICMICQQSSIWPFK